MAPPSHDRLTAAIGLSMGDGFARASCTPLNQRQVESLTATYRQFYPAVARHQVATFPGVTRMIDRLSCMGVQLALATSKSRAGTTAIVDDQWSASPFACIITDDDVRAKKPAPEMLELIMERLDSRPAHVLMVGDTSFDIQMGRAAGVRTCGVSWGNHSRRDLIDAGADHAAESVDDVIRLVEGLLHGRAPKSLSPASPFVVGNT